MAERCLMAVSLAILVFHPRSTIRCLRPKSNPTSPEKEKPPLSKPYRSLKKLLSKSKSKNKLGEDSSVSRTSSCLSNKDGQSPPLFSELVGGESTCVVEAIFRSGWSGDTGLTIDKVLKVNNGADVLNRFEEYREMVKSKARKTNLGLMERSLADGNEILRFHGAVITCSLGSDEGCSIICRNKCCGVCRVINSNLLVREGATSLCENSWRAHEKVSTECGVNGVSPAARKAIILCRVIAGRTARCHKHGLIVGEGEGGFDSVVSSAGNQPDGSEELMVLNPKAILPCFVVIYSVSKGTILR